MAIKTQATSGGFAPAPEGNHVARCIRVIDVGTQEKRYQDKLTYKRQVLIMWELPNETREWEDDNGVKHEEPFIVSKKYTLSHHENAALRQDLESWYGKTFSTADLDAAGGFDVAKLLDRPAMVTVIHSEDGKWANIKSVNPMPKGVEAPDRFYPLTELSLDPESFDPEIWDEQSDKMKQWIAKSPEFASLVHEGVVEDIEPGDPSALPQGQQAPPPVSDDDIPF